MFMEYFIVANNRDCSLQAGTPESTMVTWCLESEEAIVDQMIVHMLFS
jgi:hypothetical protein